MKHLPDLLTLRHRCPLFHSSVSSSVCLSVNSSVMSKFDIYVKVSILINYKTKQPSNLVWNISLTSRLCDKGARFSIRLSVHPSVCLLTVLLCQSSTFTSKLVFWSTTILQQPSYSTAQVKEPKNSLLRISAFRELPKNTRSQTE